MAEGASPPSGLAPELQTLQGDALLLWSDAVARRRAIEAIVTALDPSDRELAEAVARVDAAVVAGLQALGLPRGPVRRVLVEGGLGPNGRKERDCTLVLGGDRMRRLVAHRQGPDSVFRTWVHESIHARQSYPEGYESEYHPRRGYEEGVAESLARWAVRDMAGMEPIEVSYQYYVAAYRTLARAFGIQVQPLLQLLWAEPLGGVRSSFVRAVDDLQGMGREKSLSEDERVRLQGVADQLFDSNRRRWMPNEGVMMVVWRTVFR